MSESSSATGCTYRAFLSYSHADKAWADWLHRALETYRVPRRLVGTRTAHGIIPRRLHPIFRDRDELGSATDLGRKVSEALAQSANLIVICSPASAASRWINQEVLTWKRMGRSERTFCLIVDGEPNATGVPGRDVEECFCPALRYQLDANGQPTGERTESIAADARRGKDGKADAKLKLIAGMLDIGLDALRQREQHRRMQRMAVITALALLVMAVTITLAVYALVSRHESMIAQATAERRQKQAEGLVNFMLGDLNDKLQASGRLDIMQAVDDKAITYFRSLPDTDVSDTALEQRAKALEKIGSVRMQQGQLSGALVAFRASTRISSRLAADGPGDIARQVAYSRTLAFIGLTYWQRGDMDAAQQAFEIGREVLDRSTTGASEDPSQLSQLQILDNNMGHVLEARGRLQAAETEYRNTLAVSQRLLQLEPDNSNYLSQVGDAYNNLGKLALGRGDLATAIARYKAADAIQARVTADDPRNDGQREMALTIHAILGRTLAMAGDIQNGMRDMQQAVDIAGQLMKLEPANTDYQDDTALYSTQLARLMRLTGNAPRARRLTARSIAILSALTRKDPSNSLWQGDLAAAFTEQAAESRAQGQLGSAREQVQGALEILDLMLARNPDDRDVLLSTMTAKLLIAEMHTDPSAAQSLREAALETMRRQAAGQNDPRLLALQVEALLTLGRSTDAQPLIRRLWSGGYRDLALLETLRRAQIGYPPNPEFQARMPAMDPEIANYERPSPAGNEDHK